MSRNGARLLIVSAGMWTSLCFSDEASQTLMTTPNTAMVQAVLGLIFVVGLIFGLAWILKRLNVHGLNQGNHIKVLTATSLGAREKAILVDVKGQTLLLGVAPGRVSTLHVFERGDESDELIESGDTVMEESPEAKGLVSSLAANSASEFSKKLNTFLGAGNKP